MVAEKLTSIIFILKGSLWNISARLVGVFAAAYGIVIRVHLLRSACLSLDLGRPVAMLLNGCICF